MDISIKKIRKTITIQRVIQIFLLILLVFFAFQFQGKLSSQQFLKISMLTIAIQLVLFYPLNKLAEMDANREIEGASADLTGEKLTASRRKRMFSDVLKVAFFLFFATFIALAPDHPLVQGAIFFTFILTNLTFTQCLIAHLKRQVKAMV